MDQANAAPVANKLPVEGWTIAQAAAHEADARRQVQAGGERTVTFQQALEAHAKLPKYAEGGSRFPTGHPAGCDITIADAAKGRVNLPPDRKKLAVVGFSQSTMGEAPFDDPSWVIAGLNQLYRYIPRADLWFEIHHRDLFLRDTVRDTDYLRWLQTAPFPVLMEPDDFDAGLLADIPQAVRFPIEEANAILGTIHRAVDGSQEEPLDYWESSVAYMVQWGVLMGFEEIGVWGVDMIVEEEYCVSPDTRVLTADLRWVPAGKVSVGDQLIAFDEEASGLSGRRMRGATVLGAPALSRPCYRVHLSDGTSVVSSAEHRWLTPWGWVPTAQLIPRDTPHRRGPGESGRPKVPSQLVRVTGVWAEDQSWDAGYLAAAFDGEGSYVAGHPRQGELGRQSANLSFCQKPNAMLAEVQAGLAALGFRCTALPPREDGVGGVSLRGGRPEVLRFLGQVRPRRLLAKFDPDTLGRLHTLASPTVESLEPLGVQEVIGLHTSTGTFIAEGLASHNSYQKPNLEYYLGFAQGRGIRITLPAKCALLRQSVRRYGRRPVQMGPFNFDFFKKLLETAHAKREEILTELNNIEGSMTTIRNLHDAALVYARGGELKDMPGGKRP